MLGGTFLEAGQHRSQRATKASRSKPVRPRRIFIDCTATFRHDCGTGVQRVVRNLVNWSARAGREMGIECQGVAYDATHGFRTVGTLPAAPHAEPAHQDTRAEIRLPEIIPSPSPMPMLKRAVRRTLSATGLLDSARRVKRTVHQTIGSMQKAVSRRPMEPLQVHPGAGDLLLLTDTIWSAPEVWDGVDLALSRGAKLGAIVYDLIPLHFSELYGQVFPKIFEEWFDNVGRLADFVVCISESTWNDVQAYRATHPTLPRQGAALRGGWFRLGNGLDTRAAAEGAIRPQLRELFGKTGLDNPYLVVGSFDPRKDQVTVIKAFERLWANGTPARLVMIGRGIAGALEKYMVAHSQHGRNLFCFADVEDAELDFCYRHSAALITASYAEGFNLPIVESLSRGRPVLASDIPVHREVAGAHAAYFAPRAADALADLVLRHQRGEMRELLDRLEGFCWPNWVDSSRELLDRVVELYSASRVPSQAQAA